MDADVEALARAQRLDEAARLASDRGDFRASSQLFERACDWTRAAREALRAGDTARAMDLAATSGDDTLGEGVVALLERHPSDALRAARALAARGQARWAARLFEAGGDPATAADQWLACGAPERAGELLERAGRPEDAARALEAGLRRTPDSSPLRTALGALLLRFGREAAAARTLQQVPPGVPQRREALVPLIHALDHLGLTVAADEARAELVALGGQPQGTTPASPSFAQVHARLFGRYEVVREVASSATSRVLECTDLARGDRVAVKLLAPWAASGQGRDAASRFEREMRAMRALQHPGVVLLRDWVPEGPAMVLAWMGGGSLEHLLATSGPLAPVRAAEIAVAVLSAVGDAHRVGIVHRDLKPANVLFDEAGGAHVGDFGVAHLGDAGATVTAAVFGTAGYMSPEQRAGTGADPRSDVYAVGAMLREMLTDEPPSPEAVDPPPLREFHPELGPAHEALLARLLARDPAARPSDAVAARAEVLALEWPRSVPPRRAAVTPAMSASDAPGGPRLGARGTGGATDRWLARTIELAPLTDVSLERARAQARADHPSLQLVLRVDRAASVLWLASASGQAPGRPLEDGLRAQLLEALSALHEAGGVHGHVDAAHVVVQGDRAVLRFAPQAAPTATTAGDLLALSRL